MKCDFCKEECDGKLILRDRNLEKINSMKLYTILFIGGAIFFTIMDSSLWILMVVLAMISLLFDIKEEFALFKLNKNNQSITKEVNKI